MPKLLAGRGPATERHYVPDAHGSERYADRDQLVSQVTVREDGPDIQVRVFVRGQPQPQWLSFAKRDESAVISRLFRDPPAIDRVFFQTLLQKLEDAAAGQDVPGLTIAWGLCMETLGALANDLAVFSGLPSDQRGAA